MKKLLLISAGILVSIAGHAALIPKNVTIIPSFFALNVSPNGRYIGPYKGYAAVKDLTSGELYTYSSLTFGQGNCLANNGMAVGDGAIMWNGNITVPALLSQYRETEISCITPDATRVAGFFANPDNNSKTTFVPYVANLDETGEMINLEILPYPEEDLFEAPPYMISALFISDDGKTIAGQVWDNYGGYCYPIMWKDTPEGFQYSLPSAGLFNPNGVEILQNPYNNAPAYPRASDFMSGVNKGLYETAYNNWVAGIGNEPYPEDFMSAEEFAEYTAAVNAYNEWRENINSIFNQYIDNYYLILEDSPNFEYNVEALHPVGSLLYLNGGPQDKNGNKHNKIYAFTAEGLSHTIDLFDINQAPHQVLADGTLLTSPTLQDIPNCYMMLPDSDEWITLPEYLEAENPELALWIEESFPGGTGIVSMSNDKSVITGAYTVTQLSGELYNEADYNFATYVINLNEAGVESILDDSPVNGGYRVYNLQGLKVMETKEKSELNSLPKGLYIVNGKKVAIN